MKQLVLLSATILLFVSFDSTDRSRLRGATSLQLWDYQLSTNIALLPLYNYQPSDYQLSDYRWGFFGHKRINRLAVFTLPPEMMPLYKANIEYLTEHAVDADKRRFVFATEGFKHYIDLDRLGFIPEDATEAKIQYTDIYVVTTKGDTLLLTNNAGMGRYKRDYHFKAKAIKKLFGRDSIAVADLAYRNFYFNNVAKLDYTGDWSISVDSLKALFKKEQLELKGVSAAFAKDKFTSNGIVPFHLQQEYKRLVEAFVLKDKKKILKLSADIGHYLGDAHVPLHTTQNYDGQLTNQNGIHAFWETRIPELFADNQYDYWVGRAVYIAKPKSFFWKTVRESHSLLDSVFKIEKSIAQTFPKAQQYTLETKGNNVVKRQTMEYAQLYQTRMKGMVESRMRTSIIALGSVWYSAWVDAGQPDLSDLPDKPLDKSEIEEQKALDEGVKTGKMLGRKE
jgi:hypothetical protein